MDFKLSYILITIALLVSSCNTDSGDDPSSSKGGELQFNVAGVSRADESVPFTRFVVYGDIKPLTSEASNTIILFDKTNVDYTNGSWGYEGTQYWIPKHEHSFIAVAPESLLEPDNSPRYQNSQLSFEYALPLTDGNLSNTGDVPDILAATHRRYYEDTAADKAMEDKITFTFSHLMTRINIAPAFSDNNLAEDAYVTLYDIELSGVTTKAGFEILPAARLSNSQTNDMVVDMTAKETGKFGIKFSTPVKIENNATNVSLFADDEAIITFPQDFQADSDAKITVTYAISDDGVIKQGSLPLNGQKWLSGNSYGYKFTIERTGLFLDKCEINPWNEIKGEEITVD